MKRNRPVNVDVLESRLLLSTAMDRPFADPVRAAATQLLGFSDVVALTAQSPAPITLLNGSATLASGGSIDFGTVQYSGTQPNVVKTIGIRNDGSTAITVGESLDEINSMGGEPFTFTSTTPNPTTIDPGATASIDITLDVHILTLALGTLTHTLTITPADPSLEPQTVILTANVIAPPTIVATINVTSKKPAVFTDASGGMVKVRLSGSGTAALGFASTGNADISTLMLNNTTAASSFTISPISGGNGRTSITGNIYITGSLSRLNMPRVDLSGSLFSVTGAIGNLSLGNTSGLEDFEINGKGKTALHLTAGTVVDTIVNTGQPVASIHVASWTDTHSFDSQLGTPNEQIEAPSISDLVSKGDFTVGLDVFSDGSLGQATIGGSLGADPWDITGNAGNVRLVSIPSTFSGTVGGKLAALNVAQDDDGILAAGSFGQITIHGSLGGAKILAGVNLGFDGKIGGANSNDADTYAAGSIASLVVDGTGTNSLITAGFQPADGLFDNTFGSIIGGKASIIRKIVIKAGLDASTRFVAGAFGTAKDPATLDPLTDMHFVR